MTEVIQQSFSVAYQYPVFFTERLFGSGNPCFSEYLKSTSGQGASPKLLFVLDQGMERCHPALREDILRYCRKMGITDERIRWVGFSGGEAVKNELKNFYRLADAINEYGIDRHSFVIAVGGGALLDLAGYAAAVAHRGIRHIRVPTTVLSQNDSGIGVKNGINYAGKKNFLGSFAPPAAVFNDYHFLTTLEPRDWRAGIAEAIKVALIRDAEFFRWLEDHAQALNERDQASMQELIRRCAALHLQHIAGGDPFEAGSSRPLDFGHWSAHKLEQLSHFGVRHGEAVATGMALDVIYSHLAGMLKESDMEKVIGLEQKLGFTLYHPLLSGENAGDDIFRGLEEFREHLGGRLTIMLLRKIGLGEEVHEIDLPLLRKAVQLLEVMDKKN